VEGRSRRTFDEMVRLDLKYIGGWSLWLDLKILLKTPWVMVSGAGGY
jgi:lipopolysaccharide/colanic/teichoic acid biosynthesis glycosyltransferase